MMSSLLISMRARSTVGESSREIVTDPKQGMVSTKGFKVILAFAFSCRQQAALVSRDAGTQQFWTARLQVHNIGLQHVDS